MIITKGNFKGKNTKGSGSFQNLFEIFLSSDKENEFEKEMISEENLEKLLIKRDEEMDPNGFGYEEMKLEDEQEFDSTK